MWEQPKSEGRANHYLDVLVGVFAIADMKNLRPLQPRDVVEAMLSVPKQWPGARSAGGGGVRTPDGRALFATRRR